MKWYKSGIASLVAVLFICTAGRAEESASNKVWKLQVGWVHQWGRSMDVRGPAPSWYRQLGLTGGSGSAGGGAPPGWNYVDGYVLPDEQSDVRPGGDPDNPYSTHNWHYENPSQYSGGETPTLTFTVGTGTAAGGAPSVKGESSDDDFPDNGIEIKASRWLHTWTNVNVDLELVVGVAFFPEDDMETTRSTRQNVAGGLERHIYLDYFGTPEGGNWFPTLDNYGPSYYGQFSTIPGDNPIIPLEPWRTESDSRGGGIVQDTVKIKGNLWHIRGEVGLMLRKPLTDRLSAYIAPQFALEFVDVSVRRTETVTFNNSTVAKRTHRKDKTDIIPGFLLTAGADYMINENWFVGGSLGWEWLSDDVQVKVGPDTAVFDLEGGECSLYLGRKF